MNYPLISIIVPVYQVEKYLEKCINSILSQTYKNLEIILVDDGSTDNCPAICDRFQDKDSRIKVIHQDNGGLSHARNVGLEISTGDFIGFVDSDDWIEPNMYENLLSALQETGADIAVCNRLDDFEDSKLTSSHMISIKRKLYSSIEALRKIIKDEDILHDTVWNKLYKRIILLGISFPDGKIHEDILWTAKIIGKAKLLVCLDYPYYHRLQRPDSLTHNDKLILKRIYDKIEMYKQRLKYIHEYYPMLEKLAIIRLQNSYCGEYKNISLKHCLLDTDNKIRYDIHQQFCQLGKISILDFDGFYTTLSRFLLKKSPSLFLKTCTIWQKIHQIKTKLQKKYRF